MRPRRRAVEACEAATPASDQAASGHEARCRQRRRGQARFRGKASFSRKSSGVTAEAGLVAHEREDGREGETWAVGGELTSTCLPPPWRSTSTSLRRSLS